MNQPFTTRERGYWFPEYPLSASLADFKVEPRDLNYFQSLLGTRAKRNKACVYIDIPFCDSFCAFCAIPKRLKKGDLVHKYVNALKEEITKYCHTEYVRSLEVHSLYFGGGTPTVLSSRELIEILAQCKESLNFAESPEITVEAATHNSNKEKLKELFKAGVNRLSFGVQTFNDSLRKILDLRDSAEEAIQKILEAQEVGYQIVDIDLIYNLPGQTYDDFMKDVDIASQLGLQNISIHPLHVEKGTKLANRLRTRQIPSINGLEEEIKMFERAVEFLIKKGYEPQSILKFTLPGKKHVQEIFRLSHNDCLALGNHAQGNLADYVYRNTNSPYTYCALVEEGKFPIIDGLRVSKEEQMRRYMARGLALMRIEKKEFESLFGVKPEDVFPKLIEELVDKGLIYVNDEEIGLTSYGFLWGENVCTSFCSKDWNSHKVLYEEAPYGEAVNCEDKNGVPGSPCR